jgi:hypothetical protein
MNIHTNMPLHQEYELARVHSCMLASACVHAHARSRGKTIPVLQKYNTIKEKRSDFLKRWYK